MALVVFVACAFALALVVRELLKAPLHGSIALLLAGAAMHLFAST